MVVSKNDLIIFENVIYFYIKSGKCDDEKKLIPEDYCRNNYFIFMPYTSANNHNFIRVL